MYLGLDPEEDSSLRQLERETTTKAARTRAPPRRLPALATPLSPAKRPSRMEAAGTPRAAGSDWHSRNTLHACPKSRDLTRSKR